MAYELVEDPPVPNQNYALLSFAQPRMNTWEAREQYIHRKFIGWFYDQYVLHQVMDTVRAFATDFHIPNEAALLEQLQQRLSRSLVPSEAPEEKDELGPGFLFDINTVQRRYEDFRELNFHDLVKEFSAQRHDEVVVHGIKVRGVFRDLEQAKKLAMKLKAEKIEPFIDIMAAEVGKWVPFNPYPLSSMDADYGDGLQQLNQLIQSKEQESNDRERVFQLRRDWQKSQAAASPVASAAAAAIPVCAAEAVPGASEGISVPETAPIVIPGPEPQM